MMRHLLKHECGVVTSSVLQYKESDFRKKYLQMERSRDLSSPRKPKRYRSAFTTEQINILESEYRKYPYIGSVQRNELARILNIPERSIKIWFQNRRMKEKKEAAISDPECDCHNIHTNMHVNNESLYNVAGMSSAYYRCREPLPLQMSLIEVRKNNDVKTANYHTEPIAETSKTMFYKEQASKQETSSLNRDFAASLPVLNNISPNYKSSAEFSIDLCKKYRNDLIYKSQQPENNFENESIPLTKQEKSGDSKCGQNSPVDLSYNKTKCKSLENLPKTTILSSVGLQPAYVANYAQPYLPAANIVWKPVNVVPVLSTGASTVTISTNPTGNLSVSQEQPVPKKTCNCNCRSNDATPLNSPENPENPHPQFIITAVPFENYHNAPPKPRDD